jgi:8-oxo-dGTP diphosphatase/2-hydroxy-dATP diphosphatase
MRSSSLLATVQAMHSRPIRSRAGTTRARAAAARNTRNAMEQENNKIVTTLCLVHQPPKILLGMKKRGFGAGRWNGFGGKVHEGETIEEAAKRELLEEAGIEPLRLEEAGVIDFDFENDDPTIEVHFFRAGEFTGEPTESDEMKPQWFDVNEIPFKDMWPDDLYWMPLFLEGKHFKGRFLFDRPSTKDYQSKIIEHELKVE